MYGLVVARRNDFSAKARAASAAILGSALSTRSSALHDRRPPARRIDLRRRAADDQDDFSRVNRRRQAACAPIRQRPAVRGLMQLVDLARHRRGALFGRFRREIGQRLGHAVRRLVEHQRARSTEAPEAGTAGCPAAGTNPSKQKRSSAVRRSRCRNGRAGPGTAPLRGRRGGGEHQANPIADGGGPRVDGPAQSTRHLAFSESSRNALRFAVLRQRYSGVGAGRPLEQVAGMRYSSAAITLQLQLSRAAGSNRPDCDLA